MFFAFAAIAVFMYRRAVEITWPATAALFVLMACAVMCKEHTAVIPAVLLLTDYFWNPGFSLQGIRRNWKLYVTGAVLAAGAGVFIWRRVLVYSQSAGFRMSGLPWYDYFFTQCRAIWVYLRLFVVPYGQNIDYDFPVSHGIAAHGAFIGLIALAAVSVAAWVYRKRFPLAAYGWFAFLILLAPTSSFLPIADSLVERRLYLPFIGLVLICCEFLRRVRLSRGALAGLLGVVVGVYGVATYSRNVIWGSEMALWQDAVQKSPKKSRPYQHVAYAYIQQGQCGPAADEYAKAAAQSDKPDFGLMLDWGVALDCAGRENEALQKLKSAEAIQQNGLLYAQIGMIYAKTGRRDEAFRALDRAEQLDPSFEETYVYRGNLFLLSQQFDQATAQFQKALSINPSNPNAIRGLSMAKRRQPVS